MMSLHDERYMCMYTCASQHMETIYKIAYSLTLSVVDAVTQTFSSFSPCSRRPCPMLVGVAVSFCSIEKVRELRDAKS